MADMQMVQRISWSEYPLSCIFYFIASLADHLLILVAGCVVLAGVSAWWRVDRWNLCWQWIAFNLTLLPVSAAVSGCWDCLIYGRVYVTADYVSDFSPFVPVTQNVIDAHFDDYHGHLLGLTLWQLQILWFVFALTAWSLAAVIYFLGRRIWLHLVGVLGQVSRRPVTL